MEITLEKLIELGACASGVKYYNTLNSTDPDVLFAQALKDDRFSYANWLLARLLSRKQALACAIFCAEQVLHTYEAEHPNCQAPCLAIEAAKVVLKLGTKRNEEKARIAGNAVCAANAAANAAAYAACPSAYAAYAAYTAVYTACADADTDEANAAAAARAADAAGQNMGIRREIILYGLDLLMGRKDYR